MKTTNTNTTPIRISILLPTNAYFMSGIRDFTMSFIKNVTNFSQQWAYRFQSIVDELCNNAIEHGSAPGQDIKLTLIYDPQNSLIICVEDTGTGKTKMKAVEIQKIIDERKKPGYVHTGIRGRGLSNIVAGWSDSVQFEDITGEGLKITVTKKLDNIQTTSENSAKTSSDPSHVTLTI